MTRSLLMVLLLLATASAAHAQKATEIYIPIGRSPGLSGKVTVTGFIATVDDHTMVMSVKGADGGWRAVVTDRSKIYIDRSAQRRPNRYGTMDDCRPGHFCEIKYVSGDAAALRRRGEPREIEWIKIRPDNRRSQAEPADHRIARRSGSSTASRSTSEDGSVAMMVRAAPMPMAMPMAWARRSASYNTVASCGSSITR